MAIALQIKLTSALVIPAILIELWLSCSPRLCPPRRALVKILTWGVSMVAVFSLIGLTYGKGALKSSWKSHTSSQSVPGMDRPEDHKFEPGLLKDHLESVVAAGVCLFWAFCQRRLREIAFPVVLLITAAVIHTVHHPWWNYYYLHFAIPIAWLAGWTTCEIIQAVLRLHMKHAFNFAKLAGWKIVVLCVLAALLVARSESRLEWIVKSIRSRPTSEANPILSKMKACAAQTKWVYSESGIYPFHAQLPVPPGVTIVMPKRFWSGQITTTIIIEACRNYHVEMIILPLRSLNDEWHGFLRDGYSLTAADTKSLLYVAKGVEMK